VSDLVYIRTAAVVATECAHVIVNETPLLQYIMLTASCTVWVCKNVGFYSHLLSPNSITLTLQLLPKLPRMESRRHKSRKSMTQIISPTFLICVRDKVHGLCRRLLPRILMDSTPLEQHKLVCRGLVTDFVANISTCRDGLCP